VRLALATAAIELSRILGAAVQPVTAAHADTVLVLQACYLGTLQGRPMSASKIAHFLGMPRTTVIGRLAFLTEHGYAKRDVSGAAYVISPERLNQPSANLDRAVKIIREAARALDHAEAEQRRADRMQIEKLVA
jgi:DNA-binding IclR family transcriptional regulator